MAGNLRNVFRHVEQGWPDRPPYLNVYEEEASGKTVIVVRSQYGLEGEPPYYQPVASIKLTPLEMAALTEALYWKYFNGHE